MDAPAHDLAAPDAPPAETVGPYRLLGELGRGGMGVVYRAEDPRLGRLVALKVLPAALAADARAKERLLLEARAAARIDHPNVCTVYEVAETDGGRPYIALACYDGETLADRLAHGPLPVGEAVRVARGVAAGVAAAHARGVVHRDLKPSNVFLCRDGTPKVLDFGIAKVPGVALTEAGQTPGTVAYGAPEQARGLADARSDVWALGVVLHEALTGRRPFAAPYEAAVLYAVLNEDPPPPSRANPDVPAALDAVVARCLAKDPDGRFQDAAALDDALGGALAPAEAPTTARPARPLAALRAVAGPPARRLRPIRAWRAAAALLVAALVAVAAWALWPGGGAPGMPEAIHLAVLPPTPRPDGPDSRAFAEGLAETLAAGVTELAPDGGDLWVAPVSEVRALGVTSAREAGDVLGVNLALTGGLLREGRRLTLTLNLVTADDQPRTLASRTLTVAAAEEGRVRGRALLLIADMLGLDVPAEDDARLASGTVDPEAQRFFLAGVGYLERDREAEDLDRAVDLFRQAVGEDPGFAQAHARLGEAFLAKYETTRDAAWVRRAEAASETALRLDPSEPLAHVGLSHLYRVTGRYPLAIQQARSALRLEPAAYEARLALAHALRAGGDAVGAEKALQEAVRLRPGLWAGYSDLAYFYLRSGRYEEAAAQYAEVVRLAPRNVQGYVGWGGALRRLGRYAEAKAVLGRALDIRPHPDAYSNLATALAEEGRYVEAVREYRRALALDGADHVVWSNLSSALARIPGRGAEGVEALRQATLHAETALGTNPSDARTLAALAMYRVLLDEPALALRAARRAVELAPDDVRTHFELALVFEELGRRDEALDHLGRALAGGYPPDHTRAESFEDLRTDPRFPAVLRRARRR